MENAQPIQPKPLTHLSMRYCIFCGISLPSIHNLVEHTFSPQAMVGSFSAGLVVVGWICLWIFFNIAVFDLRNMHQRMDPHLWIYPYRNLGCYIFGLLPPVIMIQSIDSYAYFFNPNFVFVFFIFLCVPYLHRYLNITSMDREHQHEKTGE